MGPEHASREKKLPMVNFLIFVQKNVSTIRFQEMKIRPLKGFEKMRFLCFYIIGVFWTKIPLNLTSEGLKYPQEVRVQLETCSTINGTPVQAILDQKIDKFKIELQESNPSNNDCSGLIDDIDKYKQTNFFELVLKVLKAS